jgi:hypothetical protein
MNINETTPVRNLTLPTISIGKYTSKIIGILKDLKSRLTENSNSNETQYSTIIDNKSAIKEYEEYVYATEVRSLINEMDRVADEFQKEEWVDDEFYDFLEIQHISEHIIIKNFHEKTTESELDLLISLYEDFIKIISLKEDLFKKEELSKYDIEYDKFQDKFSKYKEKFYIDIYTPSDKHKKTIDSLYAIMKE